AEARLREAERRYRTLVERIPAITYIQEPDEPSRTTYISPQYEEILGYSPEECLKDPEHWIGILHPDDRERVLAKDRRANVTGDPLGMEYRQLAKDGSVVWIRDEAAAVRDEEGRLRYWIGVQIDITERKTLEERLEYQAFHDSLTGLPNRALFMNRLEHALSRTEREKGEVAVLFLDVDNLKVVNDTLGHEAGDWLLVAVTGRLRTCLRPADTVARLSGDEFAILLEDVEDVSRATQVVERVAEALRVPVALKERETFVTASIGIALSGSALGFASGSAREQAESLLRQADLAMYRAKSKGKAHHEIFDPSMNASAFERLEMGNDLRRALERDEFRVYYQPKMRLPTSLQQNLRFSGSSAIVATPEATKETRIVGMEALVRWEHPERGLLSPEEFIPVAEESGLIVPIGRKVLEKACRQAQAWQDLYPGEEPLSMCVNISARQFQHPELTQDITRVLQQTGLEPRCLQLEITESVVMEDAHSTLDTLRKLEDLGVGLAIDDFGTGYSSLSYLKRFPVSFLKIDRLFVEPLGENPEDAMIVSGIISLAHTLGMKVVAEGVETAAQLAYLQGLGCDMAQGNYFHKPLQAEEASALLAKNSRR
ncbi:MAG: EAL domain-containing protein, partial [Rubrobacteraceae bacterium]